MPEQDNAGAAQDEALSGVFPKARRAPRGLFKSLLNRQQFEGINPMSLLRDAALAEQEGAMSFLCDANLWRSLSAAYGKCDCMVEGKYKRARVFAFETDNLYIWCSSETGERGTGWFLSEKSAREPTTASESYQFARWGGDNGERVQEVRGFVRSLIIGAALADKGTMEAYESRVEWLREAKGVAEALALARELRTETLSTPIRGLARKARL